MFNENLRLAAYAIQERQKRQDQQARMQRAQMIYQPQQYNNHLSQEVITKLQNRNQLKQHPGPVFPLPFTMLPWPIESQIQVSFDFTQQDARQQRLQQLLQSMPIARSMALQNDILDQYRNQQMQHQQAHSYNDDITNQWGELKSSQRGGFRMNRRQSRIFKIRLFFIVLYIVTLRRMIERMLSDARVIASRMPQILDEVREMYEVNMEKVFIEFLNLKTSLEKDLESVGSFILKFLKVIAKLNVEDYSSEFYSFLKLTALPKGFPPQKYYLVFEIQRLRFNSLGALGRLSRSQQTMVIQMILILRVLIFSILSEAHELHPEQENPYVIELVKSNCKIICSVLTQILVNNFKSELILKFDWSKVKYNKIYQKFIQLSEDGVPDASKSIVKGLLPEVQAQQIVTLMNSKKVDKITEKLSEISQPLVAQLNSMRYDKKYRMAKLISKFMFENSN